MNYIGYVEGRDFFEGVADVIVTDGFVGNTLLKMAEGLAVSLFKAIAHEIITIDPTVAMKLEPVIKQIYTKNDYHEYGGVPLLGVNGACFIAHGSSQPRTIRAAIRNCRNYVTKGVNDAIINSPCGGRAGRTIGFAAGRPRDRPRCTERVGGGFRGPARGIGRPHDQPSSPASDRHLFTDRCADRRERSRLAVAAG